ncbi:hypothetical protein [Hypericibacter adhaerens]|uniref:hypothetical protein n=1 Tax=Hypericibacter adhaerens TaxID=2602016 RepID=UPI002D7E31B9|nr:hypothetical protein [Hypericibacter adhaerens]
MSSSVAQPAAGRSGSAARRRAVNPFMGLIDAVIVHSPVEFAFDGAIASDDAAAVWTWMVRDLAPDLIDMDALDRSDRAREAVESLMPELLARAKKALTDAETSVEISRRIQTQLGGEDEWTRLPVVLNALRCRGLLDKAQGFGRAANAMPDEAQLALALQSMPLSDAPVASLLMMATVGQVAVPSRLITAAIRIAGAASEASLARTGFAPLIDAMLAHAQNQIPLLGQKGTFADMDLVCRAVDRFHRLMRAVTGYVELSRAGRWATIAAALTKTVSERLDPKLRDVGPDLNKALRRRDGVDRLDSDQILSALNGIYLLATIRDSRDSLALNTLFDQVWSQTGQALEIHIERLMQFVRNDPTDRIASARLDAALKMAEVRFNQEYADTLRRAKEAAERRA